MIPQKIVFFGGSSVAGVGDPIGGGFTDRLKRWHQSQNLSHILFNLGVNGDTTSQLVHRVPLEATLRNPDLIIISVGSNDCRRIDSIEAPAQTSIHTFEKNIQLLIQVSQSICDVVFMSANPVDESKTSPIRSNNHASFYLMNEQKEYQEIARSVCETHSIPYCDIYTQWMKKQYQSLLIDGLHANSEGHEQIYLSLKNFLKKLYS